MNPQVTEILDLLGLTYDPGSKRIMIPCPLPDHADTAPSLAVYQDGAWKCFGCEGHGDMVDLYSQVRGLTRNQADHEIRRLGGRPPKPQRADTLQNVAASVRGEEVLEKGREQMAAEVYGAWAERLDKILWCHKQVLISSEQLGKSISRYTKELKAELS